MFEKPKLWGIGHRGQPPSGNGTEPRRASADTPRSAEQRDRTRNLKYAIFCLTVAILLFIGNQLAKHAPANSGQSSARLNVRFDVSFDRPSDNAPPHNRTEFGGYYIRFRLANQGNSSIYCPVRPGTNVLLGHVVHRATSQAEWMALPSSTSTAVSDQEHVDDGPAWIEMPPGGSVDGRFYDPGWPDDDHAYTFDLKQSANAPIIHFVSQPYHPHAE